MTTGAGYPVFKYPSCLRPESFWHPGAAFLDSSFRWNDGGSYYERLFIAAKTRLHGCTPTGMQVVERRREQAAEESSGLFG